MNWFYFNEAGEVVGPLSEETLRELHAIGRLAATTQVCREGSEDWISLTEALGTFTATPPGGGESVVTSAAPTVINTLPQSHRTPGSQPTVQHAARQVRFQVGETTRQATPPRSTGKKWALILGAIGGLAAVIVGFVFVTSKHDRNGGASSPDPVSEKKAPHESSAESHEFWRFRFGSTFSECAEIMKKLKNDGTFAELRSNNGDFIGWMSGSRNIDGTTSRGGEISMGGILSIPANSIQLYFHKDKDALTAIKIRSYFRISAPPNAAEILANDMEKVFNTKSEYKIEEDEVGNKRQYYYLQKGSLTVTIVGGGKIDGTNHFTVPDVRIVVKDPPPPAPPKKNPVSMVPAVKEDNRADPDNPTTPAAQFLLGKKYQEGAGVRQDFADAIKWYRKAAEQHEPRALHALAMMHTEGQGVEKSDENFKEGLVLLSEAANYGHHESQFLLGDMHKEGGRKVLACFWLYLARSSSDNKIATLARSEIAEISGQLDVEEIAQYLKLVGSWKPGNKGTAGMFNREDRVDEDDKAKQRPPASTENGPALSSDDGDVEKLLRSKYPNDAKLRSRVAEGLRLIMDKNRSVPLEAALETLERLSGGPLKDEADAAKVRVDIEQLFGAADRIGMSREDILKAAVESQERIHLMTKDILGADSRSHAASTANKFVVSAALALKQEQVTANKTASLGIKLGPERTLKQVLVYKENGHVHFMANYTAITMLQGGGAANNPSTKQKAQELLSDFEKTTNSIARRHLEIKARELIMEAEFGSPPSAKARRSKKQVIKFTPMPKNAIPETLTNPEPKKTPVHAPSLISHYKSIGFSEVEAEMFGSLYGEKAIEAAKALNLMASYYESRNTFDAERCMSWRYKAAKSGSSAAMFRLHQILHPNFALSFLGYPEGDAKQSLDWAIKAAEHGHADGMNAMGYYNWYGEYETDGGEVIMHPNKPQALVWWRKAAEAGSADAKAQIEKYRNGIPTTENKSAPSRQPNTNPAANSKTPAASDVVLPNAALSALQIIKNGSLDEARECVRLLDEQLKRTPGNTRIEKVKNTIVNIFREEASLTSALNNRLAAENKLTVQTRNLEIASQPSGLTGQINQDSVQRGQRLVAETQTAITSADSTANDRRAKLRELLNSALDELPAPEGPALEPVWRKVAGRNNIPISK